LEKNVNTHLLPATPKGGNDFCAKQPNRLTGSGKMKSSAHLRPKTGKKLCKRPCFCYYRRNGGVYTEGWRKDARHEPIIVDLEALVPKEHLLRKIERVMDYEWLYERLDPYYCHDNGRPGTDPVVLVKMVLIQHLFGIPSLRQTYREIQVNNAYRWFLGYGLLDNIPHFATVSYAFCQRFPDELTSEIFEQMLINSLRTYRMLEKYMNKQ
jgi:transposase